MNETEQFEIFTKMMFLASEEPEAVFNICCKIIISMCILNDDTAEDFKKVLDNLYQNFERLGSLDEVIAKAFYERRGMD